MAGRKLLDVICLVYECVLALTDSVHDHDIYIIKALVVDYMHSL